MKNLSIVFLAFISTTLFSCKKEELHDTVKASGTITISKPHEQQVFSTGDTVHIDAQLTANVQLHGYKMSIVAENGDTLLSKSDHGHLDGIELHEAWVNTLASPQSLKLTISTKLDHHGNNLERSVDFRVQ